MTAQEAASVLPTTIAQTLLARRKAISVEDLAELLDVSKQYLYDQAKRGTIPVLRLPGLLRFDPTQIAAWLTERSV